MQKFALVVLLALGCSSPSPGGGEGPGPSGGGSSGKGGSGGGASAGSGGASGALGGSGGGQAGQSGQGGSGGTGGAASGGQAGSEGGGGAGGAGGTTGGSTGGAAGGDAGPMTEVGSNPPPLTGNAFVYAAGAEFGGSSLTTFKFDLGTGALTRMGAGTPGGTGPDYLSIHPGGKFLYVNNETEAGRVSAFAIAADGTLSKLNDAGSGGGGPAHLWVHKSGKWVFSANYNDGKVGSAPIGDDGKLGTALPGVAAGGQAHMVLDDGISGNFVFVPCKAAGHVAMFKFDVASGKLTPNSPATVAVSGGPRHMAVNPSGKWAYVTQEGGTAITTFAYDSTTGLLSAPKNTMAPKDGAHILVHPSGNFVFHIARGGGAITTYKVGPDGALSMGTSVGGGQFYDATMTKDGKYLISISGSDVKAYTINPTTGALGNAGSGQAVNGSQSVAVTVL